MTSPCPRPIRSNEERNAGIKNSAKVTFEHFQILLLPDSPLVKLTSGLYQMFPLGFRICIIQFFQKSTLNWRQISAMITDIFY